jgi:hypothetical protein
MTLMYPRPLGLTTLVVRLPVASASQLSPFNVPGTLVGAKYVRARKGRLPKDQRVRSRAVLKSLFIFSNTHFLSQFSS